MPGQTIPTISRRSSEPPDLAQMGFAVANEPNQRKITDWIVGLVGSDNIMPFLAQLFPGPEPHVWQDDRDNYHIRSSSFLRLTEPREVVDAADTMLERMCGLLNLYGNYVGRVWASSAVWVDSDGRQGGISGKTVLEIGVVDPSALSHLEQRLTADSQTIAAHLVSLAVHDRTLSGLLEAAGGHPFSWGDVYILYELLDERFTSLEAFSQFAEVSSRQLKRLRRTANSHRHAGLKPTPNFRPMSLEEASILICGLVCTWIDHQLDFGA